ncbi:universal stress protein [Haladaptatus sp. NG-WS-4]
MFDKLLIPVDGSKPAKRAAKYGLELAVKYDASVDVLHVVKSGVLSGERSKARKREHGSSILEEVMELDIDGSPLIETSLIEGNPSQIITKYVAENDIDLITMGRYGQTSAKEYLIGTVTERVLRSVEVPVLTVTDGQVQEETGQRYERILLATDGSKIAEHAVPYGADFARRTGGVLHVITVVDVQAEAGPFDAGGVSQRYIERLEKRGQDALERFIEQIDVDDIDLQSTLAKGTTSTEIAMYADKNDIDLIVMASQGETNLTGRYLGSTTRRVLRTITRPVLVVPTPD